MSEVILFDLDGTLTDPGEGITKCVQYALAYFGIEEKDLKKLECFIGPPLLEQFMEYAHFSREEAETAVQKYRERYHTVGIYENYVYDRMNEVLQLLKDKGRILAVASSKPEIYVNQILEHYHLNSYFDEVVGSELDGRRTKKAEVIEEALQRLGYSEHRESVLMVGDRSYDVEGARECGIQCIGVAYGYGGREELEKSGAVYIADTVEDLGILALDEDEEKEKTSKEHIEKSVLMRQKNSGGKRSARDPLIRKKVKEKELLWIKLWRIIYPIGIHLLCMSIVATIGSFLAVLYYQKQGLDKEQLIEKVVGTGIFFDLVAAVVSIGILGTLYWKERQKKKAERSSLGILSAVATIVLAVSAADLLNTGINLSGLLELFPDYQQRANSLYEGKNVLILLLTVGILSPVAEEIVFRGLVHRRIRKYFGVGCAILFSSLLFGVFHGNIIQFIYAGLLGLILALLLECTGTLTAPILAHMAANIWSMFGFSAVHTRLAEGGYRFIILIAGEGILVLICYWFLFMKEKGKSRNGTEIRKS